MDERDRPRRRRAVARACAAGLCDLAPPDGVLHARPQSTFSLVWGKFLGTYIPVALISIVLIPLATLIFYLVAAILRSFFPFPKHRR